ncbi:MAG TPA: hypothetical protein VG939_14970 [Caulobacteraceae bacterium]|nr:hypothetical protein [Caulobacteraceae bacterium]
MRRVLRPAVLALALAAALGAGPAQSFPDTYDGRLQALALVQQLNADLLSRPSATETLQIWCARRGLADPAQVRAALVKGAEKPAPEAVRALLGAEPRQTVRYRHVQLICGGKVLSEADNWYLPSRLTPAMNRQLDETDTPFGLVVKPLGFTRRTLQAVILFRPFPVDYGEAGPARARRLVTPPYVLQHKALLSTAEGAPFSVVIETYTRALIDPEGR